MSRRRSKVSNQKGFTLIEIIAVLVILGILAAVAIPRFMDLTTVASDKAAMQAVAEGKSRLSNQFARNLSDRYDNHRGFSRRPVGSSNSQGCWRLHSHIHKTHRHSSQCKSGWCDGSGVKGTNSSIWVRPQ